MGVLSNLEPQRVFHYFEEICNIPHGSYNEKQLSDYLVAYANERGFECYQDGLYNVVMIIPASVGYEDEEPLILQGHIDMVCEKKPGAAIDMEQQGLNLAVNGDDIYAIDTTLGGDDGIAVAYMLAIAEQKEILHPRLEYIFTVSEEVGMEGATGIDLSMLKGKKMINIDSEEEGIFLTSCAGGISSKVMIPIVWETSEDLCWYQLEIAGLLGGHSGVEIDKKRANANKIIGKALFELQKTVSYKIHALEGGSKDNAIPSYAHAILGMPDAEIEKAMVSLQGLNKELQQEYAISDADIQLTLKDTGERADNKMVLDNQSCNRIITFLQDVQDGVCDMSDAVPGLVETSLNLGVMKLTQEYLMTRHSIRSSVTEKKYNVVEQLRAISDLCEGFMECSGDYPAWEFRKESVVRDRIGKLYKQMYGKEPIMEGIHAGLECGILASKIPDLDCVSFGPNIFDIHTPAERLSILSTKRVYEFLLEFLKQK